MLSEATPCIIVNYTYDALGKRTSTSISGQSQISYSYDNADRVTSVTQPNSVVTEYGFDAASRLTALTYKKSGVTIGALTYEYDAAGRRGKLGAVWRKPACPLP